MDAPSFLDSVLLSYRAAKKAKLSHRASVVDVINLVNQTASQLSRDGSRPEAEWKALLLCASDRWGIGKAKQTLNNIELWHVIEAVKHWNMMLRVRLASRDDTKRVQAQRIITGQSMLSITRCKSEMYSEAFNGLLAAAIHPTYGVKKYMVENTDSIPQMLPLVLQPTLPSLPVRRVDCPAINDLFAAIYGLTGTDTDPVEFQPFAAMHAMHTAEGKQRFGLPPVWDASTCGFETVIPEVQPGDILVWKTWHATGGASKSAQGPKLVAFVDMVPREYLSDELYLWYEFASRNAPMDPGAGSSRGSWLSLVNELRSESDSFGIDVNGWIKRGRGDLLSAEERALLLTRGYIVVRPPAELHPLCERSQINFQTFFKNVSGYPLDLTATSGKGSVSDMFDRLGLTVTGSDMVDPNNPFKLDGLTKSKNAQGGGAIITKSAGMGAGTTFCNEPAHVQFQMSQFVADLMTSAGGSFYDRPLLPVWERFRLKDQAAWAKAVHVDTRIDNMIPEPVKEHADGLRRVHSQSVDSDV